MSENVCAQCGMALRHPAEFHPYRACKLFGRSHDGDKVRAKLREEFPNDADRHVGTGLPLSVSRG